MIESNPILAFHGTQADFDAFDYAYADKGNSQYGMGFYFASTEEIAAGYADKEHPSSRLLTVELSLQNPLPFHHEQVLTRDQIREFIELSPVMEDVLWNFGDIGTDGLENVKRHAVNQMHCYQQSTLLGTLNVIANDFYRDENEAFLKAAQKITGYDSVQVDFENGERFYVAWHPAQIHIVERLVRQPRALKL